MVCPQCANPCELTHRFCPVCGFPISELTRKSEDPLIGTTLPGGYVILEIVGVGGMGRVYRAEQKALGRTVAVKIIHPHLLGDESAAARFITEARAASRLNHPNSVSVIDFGKNGGQLYLVMEYLRGRDLARVVAEDGLLESKRIVDVLVQTLAALGEAHELGIIHRDLKPENIVLEPMRSGADFVKVVDFGLAKMKAEVAGPGITNPGIVCGTPDYMAPEQGRGDPIDARSDLYAVGVILYQLLTGRLPFEAESPTQVVLMHLSLAPPDLRTVAPSRDLPDSLVAVTLKALQKEAGNRYQSADEFATALRDALREAAGEADGPTSRAVPSVVAIGADSDVVCSACQALVPRSKRFCGDCGARISRSIHAAKGSSMPPPVSRRDRIESILPVPLTGREEDLAWLEQCRQEMISSVTTARVSGDHGVGKTRLLKEFLRLRADAGDIIVQIGPDPWWAEVGNFALRHAIVELARLPADGGSSADWADATPEARRGLTDILGSGRVESGRTRTVRTARWTRPNAGVLSPEDHRFVAAEALRWAMMRAHLLAGSHRVLLAIDDLHAVDGASRAAFEDVIAEPPLAAILLVATHMADFLPTWAGPTRELGGLPLAIAAPLVQARASSPGSGPDARTVPPLYIDQLIRFSMEGGSDPPARMADLIALRIERLPVDARRTLQAVAVIGDAADRGTLAILLPEIESFTELLSTLSLAGLIEEGPPGITTTHPLVRDVTLAAIPAGVRRELHARAGLDPAGGRKPLPLEVRALHAYHSQNAFEALMLLEQVADRATSRGDEGACLLALRRGLDLARREIFRGELDDPMRAVLIFSRKLGEALARAGQLTDADGALREALDLAGPSGADRALVLGSLAFVARERDRSNEATVYLREAIHLAKQSAANDLVSSLEQMRRDWMMR